MTAMANNIGNDLSGNTISSTNNNQSDQHQNHQHQHQHQPQHASLSQSTNQLTTVAPYSANSGFQQHNQFLSEQNQGSKNIVNILPPSATAAVYQHQQIQPAFHNHNTSTPAPNSLRTMFISTNNVGIPNNGQNQHNLSIPGVTTATASFPNGSMNPGAGSSISLVNQNLPSSLPTHAMILNIKNVLKKELRRGKWTPEEEAYARFLQEEFENGAITDCDNGCTLRAYLARKLHCAPMRISKKFAGKGIGKHVFLARRKILGENREERNRILSTLEYQYYLSVLNEAHANTSVAQASQIGKAAVCFQQQQGVTSTAFQNHQLPLSSATIGCSGGRVDLGEKTLTGFADSNKVLNSASAHVASICSANQGNINTLMNTTSASAGCTGSTHLLNGSLPAPSSSSISHTSMIPYPVIPMTFPSSLNNTGVTTSVTSMYGNVPQPGFQLSKILYQNNKQQLHTGLSQHQQLQQQDPIPSIIENKNFISKPGASVSEITSENNTSKLSTCVEQGTKQPQFSLYSPSAFTSRSFDELHQHLGIGLPLPNSRKTSGNSPQEKRATITARDSKEITSDCPPVSLSLNGPASQALEQRLNTETTNKEKVEKESHIQDENENSQKLPLETTIEDVGITPKLINHDGNVTHRISSNEEDDLDYVPRPTMVITPDTYILFAQQSLLAVSQHSAYCEVGKIFAPLRAPSLDLSNQEVSRMRNSPTSSSSSSYEKPSKKSKPLRHNEQILTGFNSTPSSIITGAPNQLNRVYHQEQPVLVSGSDRDTDFGTEESEESGGGAGSGSGSGSDNDGSSD